MKKTLALTALVRLGGGGHGPPGCAPNPHCAQSMQELGGRVLILGDTHRPHALTVAAVAPAAVQAHAARIEVQVVSAA